MPSTPSHSLLFVISIFLGAAGAWTVKTVGARSGLLDQPGHRSSHQVPTPKGGGIGILATFVLGSITVGLDSLFWLPIAVVSLFSLLSDRIDIRPQKRLLLQFLCGLIVLIFSYDQSILKLTVYCVVLIWGCVFIVGTANFYNFMDGINGIAGLTAIVSYGLCSYYILAVGYNDRFAVLSLCIAASVLGFLPFNIPKAKVFMGDVGSILLGFLYSCIVVINSKTIIDFVYLSSFLLLFYLDELTTMVIRIKDGESLLKAHRRHLYQLLVNEFGYPHWVISMGYALVQLLIGISVIIILPYGMPVVLTTLLFYSIAFIAITVWIRCHPLVK